MPSVCIYFQVHQPHRIKPYSFFEIGKDHVYENENLNKEILLKIAHKCYLPANKLMLELINEFQAKFRIAYSISGIALEQFEKYCPEVIDSFQALAQTGCVEFLSETYYHSLSYFYSKDEFSRQVLMHLEKTEKLFGQTPSVFRNTELTYSNEMADHLHKMGYKAILTEGIDKILNGRSTNYIYSSPNNSQMKCLLKNYRLSDDIAFRFSDPNWPEHPLTPVKYAGWLAGQSAFSDCINLFMDYETIGEHQWADSGIFDFIKQLPTEILKLRSFEFLTPSQVAEKYEPKGFFDAQEPISWADSSRDLTAWRGNPMQYEALKKIYDLESLVKSTDNQEVLETWSRLQTSDHFYYMSTKQWADGEVHKYFSPYHSPYDAYIYYMNVLADFELELKKINHNQNTSHTVSHE